MTYVTPEEDTNQVFAKKQQKFWDMYNQASASIQYVLNRDTASSNMEHEDVFNMMWQSQLDFMKLLQQKRNFPEFPVDITSKAGQRIIKEVMSDCQGELWEAMALLRNSKNHRVSDVKEFDTDDFVEEMCDSLKFFLEVLILAGISKEKFFEIFLKKTCINNDRINGGY